MAFAAGCDRRFAQASAAGLKLASTMGATLGELGYTVVSGLARGIDAAAHRAALPFSTCAVVAGGVDVVYPPEHEDLAADIAAQGLVIGECAPGFVARSQDFPRRNRIIAGSCLAVVVVEAAERSGSLITARLGGEYGREVFAVPGHPLDARQAGTNKLIKEGAIFTTSADDVHDGLSGLLAGWQSLGGGADKPQRRGNMINRGCEEDQVAILDAAPHSKPMGDRFDSLPEATTAILNLLSLTPIDVDDLCRISGLEARHVHVALLSLELAGRLDRHGSRAVALRP